MLSVDALLAGACLILAAPAGYVLTPPRFGMPAGIAPTRLPFLLAVMLVTAFVFLRSLSNDPLTRRQLADMLNLANTARTYDPITPEMRRNDPPLRVHLSLPPAAGLNPKRPTFIVVLTSCSLCSLGGLSPAERLGRQFGANVLVISPNPLSQMQAFMQEHHLRAQVFSDPTGHVRAMCNATWQPRSYLLDASERLIWKQDGMQPQYEEMRQAVRAAVGGSFR